MTSLRERLVETIRRQGPIPFDEYVEAALYDPAEGFFTRGRGAGRSGGDFLTSPEVGSLFGALVARALDGWWAALGEPDPYLVVEAGAGNGRLARDVLRASPRCAPALRLVLVERSARLREQQRGALETEPAEDALGPAARGAPGEPPEPVTRKGPIVTSLDELPAVAVEGVVFANELLDNLPFRVVERTGDGWAEIRVGVDGRDTFVGVAVPVPPDVERDLAELDVSHTLEPGTRVPLQTGVTAWFAACGTMLRRGFLVVVDYADDLATLAARGEDGWLRTYRGHGRGASPLADPGADDVTCDVVVEQVHAAARRAGFRPVAETTQAEWLDDVGVDAFVRAARGRWDAGRSRGDLDALAARSIVTEAAALRDPGGLGAHRVFVFAKGRVPDTARTDGR
ncbi:MAG TPA: SAM-dependent methyltransferase [Acidimicrobiia bacterium]|nr:SAM-dependent methyltransferase [Acidimicrobiia bacterium]